MNIEKTTCYARPRSLQETYTLEQCVEGEAGIHEELVEALSNQIAEELNNNILFSLRAMTCSTMHEAFELCYQMNRSLSEFAKYCQNPSTLYDEVTTFIELGGK